MQKVGLIRWQCSAVRMMALATLVGFSSFASAQNVRSSVDRHTNPERGFFENQRSWRGVSRTRNHTRPMYQCSSPRPVYQYSYEFPVSQEFVDSQEFVVSQEIPVVQEVPVCHEDPVCHEVPACHEAPVCHEVPVCQGSSVSEEIFVSEWVHDSQCLAAPALVLCCSSGDWEYR